MLKTGLLMLASCAVGLGIAEVFRLKRMLKGDDFTAPFSFGELKNHPERFRLNAQFEGEELVVRIVKKETKNV